MKLLTVSHTPHYRDEAGRVRGWGPTVREIDYLAELFGEILHLAPLHAGACPASSLPYDSAKVEFRPLRPTGGDGWSAKTGILSYAPEFFRHLSRAYDEADAVHIRAPANVALSALAWLAFRRRPMKPCWVKYAGNWCPDPGRDPWSYRLQRKFLSRTRPGMVVTVNGRWSGDGEHVVPFLNPSLTEEDLETGRKAAVGKDLEGPLRLLFVGRLDEAKGPLRVLDIACELRRRGLDVKVDVVGDGPLRGALEGVLESRVRIEQKDLNGALSVELWGWQDRDALNGLYSRAHFMVLPTVSSEGWPKVLSEAMAYGALPMAGHISAIPQILDDLRGDGLEVGWALPPLETDLFVDQIFDLWGTRRDELRRHGEAASRAAEDFTFHRHLERVSRLFRHHLQVDLAV